MTSKTRCGYAAFLALPNAGKSTLLNVLVGQKLAIVTPKAQTTRHRITGIVMHEQTQLILVDVPGVFDAPESKPFERAMVRCAWDGARDADLVLLLMDVNKANHEANQAMLERLSEQGYTQPVWLVFNKIDTIAKPKLLELTTQYQQQYDFTAIHYISALKKDGVEELKAAMACAMPESIWLYPEDQLTDMPQRLLASEITREKCFMSLQQELPYSLTVETEEWQQQENGSVVIHQAIFVEREGQKGIVLGKGGKTLKAIGEQARKELAKLFECEVHLYLFVKVREAWKRDAERLRYLGLS